MADSSLTVPIGSEQAAGNEAEGIIGHEEPTNASVASKPATIVKEGMIKNSQFKTGVMLERAAYQRGFEKIAQLTRKEADVACVAAIQNACSLGTIALLKEKACMFDMLMSVMEENPRAKVLLKLRTLKAILAVSKSVDKTKEKAVEQPDVLQRVNLKLLAEAGEVNAVQIDVLETIRLIDEVDGKLGNQIEAMIKYLAPKFGINGENGAAESDLVKAVVTKIRDVSSIGRKDITKVLRSTMLNYGTEYRQNDVEHLRNFTRLISNYFGVKIDVDVAPTALKVGIDVAGFSTMKVLHEYNEVLHYPALFCKPIEDVVGRRIIDFYVSKKTQGRICSENGVEVLHFEKYFGRSIHEVRMRAGEESKSARRNEDSRVINKNDIYPAPVCGWEKWRRMNTAEKSTKGKALGEDKIPGMYKMGKAFVDVVEKGADGNDVVHKR